MKTPSNSLPRREFIVAGATAATAALGAPMLNLGRFRLFAATHQEYSTRTVDTLQRALVIDMLGLLTINGETQERWGPDGAGISEADVQEFRDSRIDVFHNAYGLGGSDASAAYGNALRFMNTLNGLIANRPDVFLRIDEPGDFDRVKALGRTGVLIGIQDAQHFRTPDDVADFHGWGQRVSQLTYNSRNSIGNGSTERVDGGISDFGASIVEAMNEAGMAVDVSHCGDRTTLDAFELSSRPVLITHSNCRALTPGHPRTKTDEAIRSMAATGGVMGITGVRNFVKASEPTTIEDVLNHFDHVRGLVGVEHLGVGSDIDLHGYDDLPAEQYEQLKSGYTEAYAFRDKLDIEGVDHPKRMFDLTEGLFRRGYSEQDVEGILGGNFRRVLTEIWDVA